MDFSRWIRRKSCSSPFVKAEKDEEEKEDPKPSESGTGSGTGRERSVLYKNRGQTRLKCKSQRLEETRKNRQNSRHDRLKKRRNIVNEEKESPEERSGTSGKQSVLRRRLEEFRKNKEKSKQINRKNQKPVFKVGVVQHSVNPFSELDKVKQADKNILKIHTKSINTPKNSTFAAKSAKSAKSSTLKKEKDEDKEDENNEEEISFNFKTPIRFNFLKKEDRENSPFRILKTPGKTAMPVVMEENEDDENKESTFKTPSVSGSSTGRKSHRVTPLLDDLRHDICFQRGKWSDNQRLKKGKSPVKSPYEDLFDDIDDEYLKSFEKSLNNKKKLNDEFDEIAQEKKEGNEGILKFRNLFNGAKDKLTTNADLWEGKITNELNLNDEELKGRIFAAIGQARLIMNPKGRLEQFNTLIDNAEFKRGEKETKLEDLQGFWDMIDYQLENIYDEFIKLTELEKNNWEEEEEEIKKEDEKKNKVKSVITKKVKPAVKVSSNLKAIMAAKRAAMKKKVVNNEDKEFDGGFFKITSPCRPRNDSPAKSPSHQAAPRTPKDLLRRSVLTNSIINVTNYSKSPRASLLPGMSSSPYTNKNSPVTRFLGDDLMSFDDSPSSPPRDFRVTPRRSTRISFTNVGYKC